MRPHAELRGLMAANDYDQRQLARKLGISACGLSRKMNGRNGGFRVAEAYEIMDLFHVPHARLNEIFPPNGRKE